MRGVHFAFSFFLSAAKSRHRKGDRLFESVELTPRGLPRRDGRGSVVAMPSRALRRRIAQATGVLIPVLELLMLPGCVIGRVYRDHPLDEQKIAAIERGVTTKTEVLQRFGPPQEIDARELTAIGVPFEPFLSRRGEKAPVERLVAARYFRYTFSRGNAFGIILILFNYAEFDQKNDTLLIFFDGDNKVEDFAFEKDTPQMPRYGPFSR